MRIIAHRGQQQFLVTEAPSGDINPPSQIVDIKTGLVTPMPAQQALKWGYWEEAKNIAPDIMAKIQAATASTTRRKAISYIRKLHK